MKLCKVVSVAIFAAAVGGCGTTTHTQNTFPGEHLYGGWNCTQSVEAEGTRVHIEYVTSYVRNGQANSFGILKIAAPELPEMEYSVSSSGRWEVKDGYLIETTDEVKLVNVSHPGFDEILDLESMFPQKMSESYEIVELNGSVLKVRAEMDNSMISCSKA